MELGNLIFGNSRGEYPIEQRAEFEEVLYSLFKEIGLNERGYSENNIVSFENDVFVVRPYYWGDDENIAELPNFEYKPSNFHIKWYKYPLRDSYMNQNISLQEFKDIIESCKEHVKN